LAVHSKRAAWHVLPQHTAALNGLTGFTCVTPAPQKALVRHFCLTLELKKHIGDPVLPVRGPDPTRGNVHYIDGTEFKFGPHIHDQCHRFIHTYPISVALLQAERHHHSYNLDIFSFSTTSHQKVKREMQYRPVPCKNCAPSSRLHVTTVSID